jgi:hypothetical protein
MKAIWHGKTIAESDETLEVGGYPDGLVGRRRNQVIEIR